MQAKDTIPAEMAFMLREQKQPGSSLIGNLQLLQEQAGDKQGKHITPMQKVCQIATALFLWSCSGMLAKDTICAEMAFMLMERNRPGSIYLKHHLLKGGSLAVEISQDNHFR